MHKVEMNRCLSNRYFLLSIVNSMGRACGMGRVTWISVGVPWNKNKTKGKSHSRRLPSFFQIKMDK